MVERTTCVYSLTIATLNYICLCRRSQEKAQRPEVQGQAGAKQPQVLPEAKIMKQESGRMSL